MLYSEICGSTVVVLPSQTKLSVAVFVFFDTRVFRAACSDEVIRHQAVRCRLGVNPTGYGVLPGERLVRFSQLDVSIVLVNAVASHHAVEHLRVATRVRGRSAQVKKYGTNKRIMLH